MHNNKDHISKVYLSLRTTLARAVSHIVPPKEIEDIVQETYVRVCQIENPEEIRHPRSFLLKTAKNLAFDHIKRAETRLAQSMDEELEAEWTEQKARRDDTYDKVAANQEFAHFCEAVRHLPLQCRKVFVLKKVYGYSQREIANQLEISESTVEKHIANGIKRCTYYMASHTDISDSASAKKAAKLGILGSKRQSGDRP
ncbi:MAG: RNA polymerase sigma factor [Agarilytica sp.]